MLDDLLKLFVQKDVLLSNRQTCLGLSVEASIVVYLFHGRLDLMFLWVDVCWCTTKKIGSAPWQFDS